MSRSAGPARRSPGGLRAALGPAALGFAATRVVVAAALGVARLVVALRHEPASSRMAGTSRAGLLAWDGSWYERIAELGYVKAGPQSFRFFPLFPFLGRALGHLPGISDGTALLLVANVAGFLALVLLHLLVSAERLPPGTATRSVLALSLWPAAFVLAMGYSESLLLLASLAAFWCWRTGRWWWSIVPAFLAGLTRPVGLLLAVPAAVEAVLAWRAARPAGGASAVVGRALAVLAAPAGALAYLASVAGPAGGLLQPLRLQLSRSHRGSIADPLQTVGRDLVDLASAHHLGTALHAPFAIVFVVLTVYLFFRLPACYAWYAAATMAVALTAPNLDSLERYGLACFPLAIGAALLTARWRPRVVVPVAAAAVMGVLATLAFLGYYVP